MDGGRCCSQCGVCAHACILTLLSGCLLLAACCAAQVWYDNRADDLTKEGMLKGIEQAAAFIFFLR